jgi:hypothetical protein
MPDVVVIGGVWYVTSAPLSNGPATHAGRHPVIDGIRASYALEGGCSGLALLRGGR